MPLPLTAGSRPGRRRSTNWKSPLTTAPRFFAAEVGMSAVWLCPLRLRSERPWPLYPLKPGEVYVNFGFWGTVPLPPGQTDGYHNRLVEAEVGALGGHKGLYSTSFYSEEE